LNFTIETDIFKYGKKNESFMEIIQVNEYASRGSSDAAVIKESLKAAKTGDTVCIPRYNARTGKAEWRIGETVILRSGVTLLLDSCYLIMETGAYCSMFGCEPGASQPTGNVPLGRKQPTGNVPPDRKQPRGNVPVDRTYGEKYTGGGGIREKSPCALSALLLKFRYQWWAHVYSNIIDW